MISKELKATIIRLYHVEKWKVGTIALQYRVHHATVTRIVSQDGSEPRRKRCFRKMDPFIPFINEQLSHYPSLTAARIYEMIKLRGYNGQASLVRLEVAKLRGSRKLEAFQRLTTLPGEEAQVDWGHFGRLECGKAHRPLMAFVMVLSYSRAVYLEFFLSQSLPNFIQGHEHAFRWFGGVPRQCLYDNLKSVVIERIGKAIHFNENFIQFSSHYRFEPRPVAVARGNEKGRVERAIRYIRTNFFEARQFENLADLNRQALEWCQTTSLDRNWQEDSRQTIREVFTSEKSSLLPLPENPYPSEERHEVSIGKTPYARFDLNDYSVPHTAVQKTLVVMASVDTVRILDGDTTIATHTRSYDRGKQIEDQAHLAKLEEVKAQAGKHRQINRLTHAIPSAIPLLKLIAERGLPLQSISKKLLQFLQTYGYSALDEACQEALLQNTPHPQSIKLILERQRREQGKALPMALPLPDDPRVQNIIVKPQNLDNYNCLLEDSNVSDPNNE